MDGSDWQMVTSTAQLREACASLRDVGSFGMDMEFRRDKTYLARLDLVQLAGGDRVWLVDPQADVDLEPLFELIEDPAVEVVVHSGRQDLEISYELGGRMPTNIFDTQVAAALVGFGDQAPYDRLLQSLAGQRIGKLETTSDWSRRPLTERQISYALDDVRYLPELRAKLGAKLEELGRTDWAAEEMSSLTDPSFYDRDPDQLWRSVSGSARLRPRELAVLRELAAWREEMARSRNLPRRWVLPDDVLVDIARRSPEKIEDIETISRLPEKVLKREGDEIVRRVAAGLARPAEERPEPPSGREDQEVVAAADILELFLKLRSGETGIAKSILGTRKDIFDVVKAVRGDSDVQAALLKGWRKQMVGDDLSRLARGELALSFDPATGRAKVTTVGT